MLTAFTAGLLLITVSELGDKTFFIAAILAMRHPRRLVFAGVIAALAAMTVLSVIIGQAAASLLPKVYIHYAAVALFLGFGVKLLYEASKMPAKADVCEEAEEAAAAVKEAELKMPPAGGKATRAAISLQSTQIAILLQSFVLTFLAEWGDRTQIATINLAAANNPVGVTVGAVMGHTICAIIAVVAGRTISGRISERTVTGIGGCLFLIFGAVALLEGVGN